MGSCARAHTTTRHITLQAPKGAASNSAARECRVESAADQVPRGTALFSRTLFSLNLAHSEIAGSETPAKCMRDGPRPHVERKVKQDNIRRERLSNKNG